MRVTMPATAQHDRGECPPSVPLRIEGPKESQVSFLTLSTEGSDACSRPQESGLPCQEAGPYDAGAITGFCVSLQRQLEIRDQAQRCETSTESAGAGNLNENNLTGKSYRRSCRTHASPCANSASRVTHFSVFY